jgi:DNA-binding transcriptional MerR regulator
MAPSIQAQVDLNASRVEPSPKESDVPAQSDQTVPRADEPELVPIDEVARRLGVRASAIRYYEERGLVRPVSRHSGRRWYGPSEIRLLAVIQYWRRNGLMSLDEIGDILAGPAATRGWAQIVEERIEALRRQAESRCGPRTPGTRAVPPPRLPARRLRPLRVARPRRRRRRGLARQPASLTRAAASVGTVTY